MPNKYIYYGATAVSKNTTSLQLIKSNNIWLKLLSAHYTKDASLICSCDKGLKLKWANCFVNTLTSGHLVREHLSGLNHVQTYLCCHSVLRAGIKSCWLEIPVPSTVTIPLRLSLSTAIWEREETGRRPHTEDTQVSLPRYVVHTSVTHMRGGTVRGELMNLH